MAKIKIKYADAKEYEKKGIIKIIAKDKHTKHKDDDMVEAVTVEAVTVEEDEKNIKKTPQLCINCQDKTKCDIVGRIKNKGMSLTCQNFKSREEQ